MPHHWGCSQMLALPSFQVSQGRLKKKKQQGVQSAPKDQKYSLTWFTSTHDSPAQPNIWFQLLRYIPPALQSRHRKSIQDSGPDPEHLRMLLHSGKGQSQKPNSDNRLYHPLKATRFPRSSPQTLSTDLVLGLWDCWGTVFALYSALILLPFSNCWFFISFNFIFIASTWAWLCFYRCKNSEQIAKMTLAPQENRKNCSLLYIAYFWLTD